MDQQELQRTIAKYYQKLPEKAGEYFASMNWLEILKGIKEKNNLSESQIETLSIETTLLLLAVINKEEYEAILEKDLELERNKLDLILKEIDAYIFNNIGLELRETFEKNQDESIIGNEIEENTEVLKDITELANKIEEKPKILSNENESKVELIVGELNHEEKVYQIGRENNLTIAQITKLDEIVSDILNGKIFGDQFLNALNALNLDEDKKKNIASRINNEVFKEIRNRMMGKVLENKGAQEQIVKKEEIEPMIPVINKNPEEIALEKKIIEDKKITSSIINQKLGSQVKSNITDSVHSLPNINENSNKKIDPYREIPE
jgi:hypothetical protein